MIAEIAALPPDRVVRAMVRARMPAGSSDTAKTAAVQRLAAAARSAGAVSAEPMAGQPIVVVEAKPAALAALMRSGAAEAIQLDRTARPQ